MIWLSVAAPEIWSARGRTVEDPPDGAPDIEDPSREVPAVDPDRRDAPEPVREPQGDPPSERLH